MTLEELAQGTITRLGLPEHRGLTLQVLIEALQQIRDETRARYFLTYPHWRWYQSLALDDSLVSTLIDLARDNKRDDFDFLAGSAGVPSSEFDRLWEGTRRRLGL